jgi:3-hydroxyethyl bacteriochlorophyllide a dehydrogenase
LVGVYASAHGGAEVTSNATAVVFEQPGHLSVRRVELSELAPADCLVDVEFSGISTGTERLLWQGKMPSFPGLAYPLVPGYESVGRVSAVGADCALKVGDRVFIPGSRGFVGVHGLFGGAADRLVVDSQRLLALDDSLASEEGTLLALAATAYRAVTRGPGDSLPHLIVGHGVLGRLVARLVTAIGGEPPVVWEANAARRQGSFAYPVVDPTEDASRSYRVICDVSGDVGLVDTLISRLTPGGCLILAGFYHAPVSFDFPPAFLREAQIHISAEWQAGDLAEVARLISEGRLSLDGLITHRSPASEAAPAYRTAFGDADCLKMVLDWRSIQ